MTNTTTTSYIIKKNNRRYGNKSFSSYEQARSYVRKKLRAQEELPGCGWDVGFQLYNNPSHSRYGFSIVKNG